MTFAAISDLHEIGDFTSTNHVIEMLNRLDPPPEFVVFTGDILYNDYGYGTRWSRTRCSESVSIALQTVAKIGFPFLFTFGSHDVVRHGCRSMLAAKLSEHILHIGWCAPGRATCLHPYLPIATIDSLKRNCRGNMDSLGCPTKADVRWIGDHAENGIIFTNFPPPAVLKRRVRGFTGEQPGCWSPTKAPVLPPHRIHAFGHDHDNMYISEEDHSLIALFKSGVPGYGPAFTSGSPGLTVFDAEFVPTFYKANGQNWSFETLPNSTVGSHCEAVEARFIDSGWFFALIVGVILVVASLVFGLIERSQRAQSKRREKYAESYEALLSDGGENDI